MNNKDIEFKGKNLKGEWLYGDLIHAHGKVYIVPPYNIENKFAQLDNFEVIEETVGQFTGLYATDAERVYENDLIRIGHSVFPIKFEDKYYSMPFVFFNNIEKLEATIIGTIFDED